MVFSQNNFRVFYLEARKFYRGIFPFYKEPGVDSQHVLDWIRLEVQNELECTLRKLQIELRHSNPVEQPFAGMNVIALGCTEKYLRYMKFLDSVQRLTLKLGERTATDEASSPVVERKNFDHVTKLAIEDFCSKCVGTMFLAIPAPLERPPPIIGLDPNEDEVNERRLFARPRIIYREARLSREIQINKISIVDYSPPVVKLELNASPYFIPRSFAATFAAELGTCAHVLDYERRSIGPFRAEDCLRKHELYSSEIKDAMNRHTANYIDAVRPHLDKLVLFKAKRLFNY